MRRVRGEWLAGLAAALLLGGCSSSAKREAPLLLPRFYMEAGSDAAGMPVQLPQSGVTLVANTKPVITEGDIVNVELVQVELGKALMFQLTPSATRDFYRLSGTHQGRRLVLVIDGNTLGARRIDGAIGNGVVYIFVETPEEELAELVRKLKQSALATQREIRRKG